MEDNEGVENAKEEVQLGKLQFSMDYDFQKSEVGVGGGIKMWVSFVMNE